MEKIDVDEKFLDHFRELVKYTLNLDDLPDGDNRHIILDIIDIHRYMIENYQRDTTGVLALITLAYADYKILPNSKMLITYPKFKSILKIANDYFHIIHDISDTEERHYKYAFWKYHDKMVQNIIDYQEALYNFVHPYRYWNKEQQEASAYYIIEDYIGTKEEHNAKKEDTQ